VFNEYLHYKTHSSHTMIDASLWEGHLPVSHKKPVVTQVLKKTFLVVHDLENYSWCPLVFCLQSGQERWLSSKLTILRPMSLYWSSSQPTGDIIQVRSLCCGSCQIYWPRQITTSRVV